MVNLKGDIWIEGFDDFNDYKNKYIELVKPVKCPILFAGKTSEISEIESEKYADTYYGGADFFDYESDSCRSFNYAKDSIKSACNKEYCIIYKKIDLNI